MPASVLYGSTHDLKKLESAQSQKALYDLQEIVGQNVLEELLKARWWSSTQGRHHQGGRAEREAQ